MNMNQVGERIRSIREEKKFSGTKIAEMLGITPAYFYDIEKGKRNLSAKNASKLAIIFGVSLDYLLMQQNSEIAPIMSIGRNVKFYRKQRGLTQSELAQKANLSRSYLADVEADRYNPSVDTLKTIADALQIGTHVLLDEEDQNELLSIITSLQEERDRYREALEEIKERIDHIQADWKIAELTNKALKDE